MTNIKEERRAVNEVRDRPAETSVRLLVGVTTLAVALIAYFGDRFIHGQDELIREVSKINVSLSTFDSRISRNEADIKDIWTVLPRFKTKGIK